MRAWPLVPGEPHALERIHGPLESIPFTSQPANTVPHNPGADPFTGAEVLRIATKLHYLTRNKVFRNSSALPNEINRDQSVIGKALEHSEDNSQRDCSNPRYDSKENGRLRPANFLEPQPIVSEFIDDELDINSQPIDHSNKKQRANNRRRDCSKHLRKIDKEKSLPPVPYFV